ncbi:hypothetical protein RRG08_025598 [Elysia crispata]|uniref:Uncharacterized protein n=1 Tax=Elysia crispata TaxID=231223 RepID=A0AAE0YE97_9GAST|nr:hypothetical protein RRG08_025598 [Elysia crispata]
MSTDFFNSVLISDFSPAINISTYLFIRLLTSNQHLDLFVHQTSHQQSTSRLICSSDFSPVINISTYLFIRLLTSNQHLKLFAHQTSHQQSTSRFICS